MEHILIKFYLKFISFHSRKCIGKCCLQNVRHVVWASLCYAMVHSEVAERDHSLLSLDHTHWTVALTDEELSGVEGISPVAPFINIMDK